MRPLKLNTFLIVSCFWVFVQRASADVKLPALFADNMVLQRGMNVPVWGTADTGEEVTVTVGAQTHKTTAGNDGKWMVKLIPFQTFGPIDFTVSGKNTITLHNVAIGEVWVCSGQSNMEFTVNRAMNAQQEIAAANYPMIRHFAVKKTIADQPRTDAVGQWAVCTPQTVGGFTAVGYFFARELHRIR